MTTGLQERIESRPAGQIAISAFIVVTLLAICVTVLPDSLLRREVSKVTQPYLEATGLDQNWRIFAPDPRQTGLRIEASVRYADGGVEVWRPPKGGDLLGAYWDYRWAKWLENVTQDAQREVLWRPAAQFVARQMRRPGRDVRSVTLIRSWQDLRPPGARGPDRSPWQSYSFYRLAL
jgi:hypothetical protein